MSYRDDEEDCELNAVSKKEEQGYCSSIQIYLELKSGLASKWFLRSLFTIAVLFFVAVSLRSYCLSMNKPLLCLVQTYRFLAQDSIHLRTVGSYLQHYSETLTELEGQLDRIGKEIRSGFPNILSFPEHPLNIYALPRVLYPNERILREREEFHRRRIEFVRDKYEFDTLPLAQYNLATVLTDPQRLSNDMKRDYERLDALYNFQKYQTELPFCILVSSFKNNEQFRLEMNLNSILTQNYTNFKMIIMQDASGDGSAQIISAYLQYFKKSNAKLIANKQRHYALFNLNHALHNECDEKAIGVIIDGDDELLGRNVLKTLNAVYQSNRPGVVYSKYIFFNQFSGAADPGRNAAYTLEQKDKQLYRQIPFISSHLRTFLVQLYRELQPKDLTNSKGEFYLVTCDIALMLPMLQMACSRVVWLQQFQYLYNVGTGWNDYSVAWWSQYRVEQQIRSKDPYLCSQAFLKRVDDDASWK